MLTLVARFDVHLDEDDILNDFGLQDHGPVQMLIDQRVIDYCRDGGYVPASPARTLEDSPQIATEIGSGEVIWDTPYARLLYYDIVYGPNIPILDKDTGVLLGFFSPPGKKKHPTVKKFTYDKAQNPNAGAYWFERMKADHGGDIVGEAKNFVRRGGRST